MFNDLLNIVANDYRRCVLLSLLDCPPREETKERLPDDVAITEAEHDALVAELRHCHLPMLAESELIEWERDRNEIAKGPRFDDVQPLLELFDNHGDELPETWLATSTSVG